MRTIAIQGQTSRSTIFIGESYKNLPKYLNGTKTIIVTDENINSIYHHDFQKLKKIEIGTGEEIKTLDTVQNIYKKLMEFEADRTTFIVGLGGGIVCDITGYAASTYMRGLDFGFVSTSLLSQVDASVGGKNGVNFLGYKNMIGVFNQPQFVICDLEMLRTLPQREKLTGFSEVIKHAIIQSNQLLDFLENNSHEVIKLEKEAMEKVVYDSIKIKSKIVNKDEKEKGERRKLNFGHTLGHAIEKTIGISHGEAISIGMVFAARLSAKKHFLSEHLVERLINLLKLYGLPTEITVEKAKIIQAIRMDKKRGGEEIYCILLKSLGEAITKKLSITELEEHIHDLC